MRLLAVAVKDLAAEAFTAPFFVPTEAVALRSFAAEVNTANDKNALYLNPEHFELHALGSFDDNSGLLVPEMVDQVPRSRLIARGEDVKRRIQ